MLAGDDRDDIWLLDRGAGGAAGPALPGLGGEAAGVATHPLRPELYASCACGSGLLLLGEIGGRRRLRRLPLHRDRDVDARLLSAGDRLRPA